MALAQVQRLRLELHQHHPSLTIDVLPVTTSGDRWQGKLADLGGKGAFTKDLDRLLVAGEIDVVVHCLKDIPGDHPLPGGTHIAGYLARDDIRDALVHPGSLGLSQLPPGTRVGTSAVRRAAQLRRLRPDLSTVPIRGNVNTRLAKLDEGVCDALLVAYSGLIRVGLAERATEVIPTEVIAPPIGAGILALQCRIDRPDVAHLLAPVTHQRTEVEARTERAFLAALGGNCSSPIAGVASITQTGRLHFQGWVYSATGSAVISDESSGEASACEALGQHVAESLLRQGARSLLEAP